MTVHIAGKLYTDTGQLCARSMVPPSSAVFIGGTAVSSSPSCITSNLAAAYLFNTGITVTGSGVSSWADQSGNGRNLLQGTDTNRPAKQSDGSILFDGVDNFLTTGAFTLNQPETVYLLAKQITWSLNEVIFDGFGGNRMALIQSATTPNVRINAGSGTSENTALTLDTYAAIGGVFNGASSSLTINTTTVTGNVGAGNGGGFILGSGDGFGHSNIQVKTALIYSAAHTSTQIADNINYLTNGPVGTVYVEDLTSSPVPAGSVMLGGIAHNQNGRMYVTTDAPSSPVYLNGIALRHDGALHVSTSTDAGDVFINGAAVSQTGQLRIFYV